MSYQVFARKYRPLTFDDVLGQDHVVRTLKNAIEQNRLAHAYLFVGPRGTGKTSTARILAKALNCPGGPKADFDPHCDICEEIAEGRSLDVLEIDGASNRGIDHIRDLRDNVQFAPARGQFRIVYIDEVHMLTKESFNALLKTLEEPPSHVKFIFATTEPHKILPTILSRCQRFDLRPIPAPVIARHLMDIAAKEGVSLSEAAAFGIARVADGGMRDAQSMLDQLVSFCGNAIEESHVNDIFGVTSRETVARALAYLLDRQLPSLLHMVHELAEMGRDMGSLLAEIMGAVRELLVAKVAPGEEQASLPETWRKTLAELLARTPTDKILRLMEVLSSTEERMRWSTNKRLHLEMGLIQAVHSLSEANISDIIRALDGAPLPDTPIATTVLPPVAYPVEGTRRAAADPGAPAAAAAVSETPAEPTREASPDSAAQKEERSDAAVPSPEPEPEAVADAVSATAVPDDLPEQWEEPPSVSELESEPESFAAGSPSLEPIDDMPPSFDAPAAGEPMPAPAAMAEAEPVMEEETAPSPDFPEEEEAADASGTGAEQDAGAPRPLSAALWQEALELLAAAKPIQSTLIGNTEFVDEDDGLCTVALNPADISGRDTLLDEELRCCLEENLSTLARRTVTLRVVFDEAVPLAEEEELPAPAPTPRPVPKTPAPRAEKPAAKAQEAEPAAQARLEDEEFYNDPLIQQALDAFHARLLKNPKPNDQA